MNGRLRFLLLLAATLLVLAIGSADDSTAASVEPPEYVNIRLNWDYDGNYKVNWSEVEGATRYEAQEQENGGAWHTIYTGPEREVERVDLTDGLWCYRVRASDTSSTSIWSEVECGPVYTGPQTDSTFVGEVIGRQYCSSDLNKYGWIIKVSSVSEGPSLLQGANVDVMSRHEDIYCRSDIDPDIAEGDIVEVRGRLDPNANLCSFLIDACRGDDYYIHKVVPPDAPILYDISNDDEDGNYYVRWIGDAATYKLQERVDGGSWEDLYEGRNESYYVSDRDNGEWCYRAVAYSSGGVASDLSNIVCTTVELPGQVDLSVSIAWINPQDPRAMDDLVTVNFDIENVGDATYDPESDILHVEVKLQHDSVDYDVYYQFEQPNQLAPLSPGRKNRHTVSLYLPNGDVDSIQLTAWTDIPEADLTNNVSSAVNIDVQPPTDHFFECFSLLGNTLVLYLESHHVPASLVLDFREEVTARYNLAVQRAYVHWQNNDGVSFRQEVADYSWDLFKITQRHSGPFNVSVEAAKGLIHRFFETVNSAPQCGGALGDQLWLAFFQQPYWEGVDLNSVVVQSPLYVRIEDDSGRKAGFNPNGSIVNEIDGADVTSTSGGEKLVVYPGRMAKTIELFGHGNGTFDLLLSHLTYEHSIDSVHYQNVGVTSTTRGSVDLAGGNYVLRLDNDGNGTVDRAVLPNSVERTVAPSRLYLPVTSASQVNPDARLYELHLETSGQGTIAVSPNRPSYQLGETVTLQAAPAPGWEFVSWIGSVSGSSGNTQLIMDGDREVMAIFEQNLGSQTPTPTPRPTATPTTPSNSTPYVPYSPSPADGATGVSTQPTLSWRGGDPDGDSVTYDVDIKVSGTSNWHRAGTGLTSTSATFSSPLEDNTSYDWRVIARDEHGYWAESNPWTFSTAARSGFEVVADGLANPRGLAFDNEGSLYIAEAGSGGAEPCFDGLEGLVCFGTSGAVTKVTFDANNRPDSQTQLHTGLPSLGLFDPPGTNAIGPSDVVISDDSNMLYILTGLGEEPTILESGGVLDVVGEDLGQILEASLAANNWQASVNLAAFEAAENPDSGALESNPYAMINERGTLVVVDAGGNDLLSVEDGTIATLAVFPPRMVEFPPGSGQMLPMEAVPTSVTVGPDGAYYVGQLTGFPFPLGGANVYRVEPGQAPKVYASGFTNILDVAFDSEGKLCVLEMFTNGLLTGDPTGKIICIDQFDSRLVLASQGLINPGAMAFGPDGMLYVSNLSTNPTDGQVIRFDPYQGTNRRRHR